MFANSFREENSANKSEEQKDTVDSGQESLRQRYWELFALAESLNKILLENPGKNTKVQDLWNKSDRIAVRIDEGEDVPEAEINELMEEIRKLISSLSN